MPIYEFYCEACNTLFNFFSPRVDTTTQPRCPRCHERDLERRPARFATLGRGAAGPDAETLDGLDEARVERVLGSMMSEIESLGESDDPRRLATILRRFGHAAGLEPGPRMEEILSRLEAGEDPDQVEPTGGESAEQDDSLDELFRLKRRLAARASGRPRVDDTLHFL